MWVYLHSFSRCSRSNMPTSAKFRKVWTYSSSRSFKVDDFGTNRKGICHFLLVINSNFGPILHRFWDTTTYWLKIAHFSYPCLIRRLRSLFSLWNFMVKLSVMGLLCGEDCVILALTVFDWSTRVTDRRTDGRAMAYSAKRAMAYMLSRAKNINWIVQSMQSLYRDMPVTGGGSERADDPPSVSKRSAFTRERKYSSMQ